MKRHLLQVTPREATGKKVKKLRKDGILPGNLYGRNIESLAVQVPLKDFMDVFNESGETTLVDLEVNGTKKPVLIHKVQLDYITQKPLHADFFQVNLKEKVKTMVPVMLVGEPTAVTENIGLLLQTLSQVEIEALPTDLPEHLEVDITHLAAVNDQVNVSDLKQVSGVEILTESSQIVAKISELVSKEAEEQIAEEEAAAEEAKAEGDSEKTDEAKEETTSDEKSDKPTEESPKEDK